MLERTKGLIFALPYNGTPADYVTWIERIADTGDNRTRLHFCITVPKGRTVMLDAWEDWERESVAFIAQRWGLPSEPRFLRKQPEMPPVW
ncbi:hypothetical protein GCM10007276_30340 [Agaricicola taiwanensis]|uniref:Uncharacterized protein n=1 Tax=Agaricicola taiwanensis TaxID=591372 RepID=A0A8J3DX93_9RHOB|nr:hypothetical protein [Agaricicola taiwanensis]GGE51212.1 hypothetical protein GCM10007276_30340 [Agaricicola taiwanensis]